jgi:exoribonuclease II
MVAQETIVDSRHVRIMIDEEGDFMVAAMVSNSLFGAKHEVTRIQKHLVQSDDQLNEWVDTLVSLLRSSLERSFGVAVMVERKEVPRSEVEQDDETMEGI